MMSPRIEKPIPAAINVKKLAQKSIMLLNDALPASGGGPAAMLIVAGPGCGGRPGEIDSDFSLILMDSLPENDAGCGIVGIYQSRSPAASKFAPGLCAAPSKLASHGDAILFTISAM